MADTILITGNTYPVREQIKALGARWDATNKGWRVPTARAEEARQLVAGAGRKTPAASPKGAAAARKASYAPASNETWISRPSVRVAIAGTPEHAAVLAAVAGTR